MKKSKLKSFDKALKAHFESKALSENQLDKLFELQREALDYNSSSEHLQINSSQGTPQNKWWKHFLPNNETYRPAFFITIFMLFTCLFAVYNLLDSAPLSQRIMQEIVYNHKQDMPVEVSSSSLTEISQYLDKLNFSMVLPNVLSEPNWQLLGGRYCSINGKLAAQLKVKNLQNNSTYTFYQAAIDKELDETDLSQMRNTIDGIGVSIWREQGVLLGLARENLHQMNNH